MLLRQWKKIYSAVALIVFFFSSIGRAADFSPEEIKASYIIKMQPFIAIGAAERAPSSFCYYEKPGVSYAQSVGQIMKKYIQQNPGKKITVRGLEDVADIKNCDVLFIPDGERASIERILAHLGTSPTLTISDSKRFILKGGMIGFVFDDANRVRMEANLTNIRAKNIRMGAKVLELMQQVVN